MTEILHYTYQTLQLTPWLLLHTQKFITEDSKAASEIKEIIPSEECKPDRFCFKFNHIFTINFSKMKYSKTQNRGVCVAVLSNLLRVDYKQFF